MVTLLASALANRYGVQSLNDRELVFYTKLKAHGVEDVDYYTQEYANAKTGQKKSIYVSHIKRQQNVQMLLVITSTIGLAVTQIIFH